MVNYPNSLFTTLNFVKSPCLSHTYATLDLHPCGISLLACKSSFIINSVAIEHFIDQRFKSGGTPSILVITKYFTLLIVYAYFINSGRVMASSYELM